MNQIKENPMMKQVFSIPQLIREQIWKIEEDTRLILSTPEIYSAKNIYITGCGDSLMAAMCASMAFSTLARANVHTPTALQASQYIAPIFIPCPKKETLVIGISNSGETARVVEALGRFTKLGANTLAVTCQPESRLSKAAKKVLKIEVPPFVSSPGVRSYVIAQIALYLLAIRFGEVRGIITMSEAGILRSELASCADILEEKIASNVEILSSFACRCVQEGDVEFIGCGPALGAAKFGAAKILEAAGMRAEACETEEFAHLNYFRTNPQKIPTVLLAPCGSNAQMRTEEIKQILHILERPSLILEDSRVQEMFAPLLFAVELAQLAAYYKNNTCEEYFRGHRGAWSGENYRSVRDSIIEI